MSMPPWVSASWDNAPLDTPPAKTTIFALNEDGWIVGADGSLSKAISTQPDEDGGVRPTTLV